MEDNTLIAGAIISSNRLYLGLVRYLAGTAVVEISALRGISKPCNCAPTKFSA